VFTGRPTEVAEQDVYVCESLYEEARRQVHKLGRDGIRKYQHAGDAIEDEIYFFRRLINPAKVKVTFAIFTIYSFY
jgi:protein polybromo-1